MSKAYLLENDISDISMKRSHHNLSRVTTPEVIKPFPYIIHQYWDTADIPEDFLLWIRSWTKNNPSWQYWFWTRRDAVAFLKPYPAVKHMFLNKTDSEALAILKYYVIYHIGGVFVDIDYQAKKPLGNLTTDFPCFGLEENHVDAYLKHSRKTPLVISDMVACRPRHPFFKKLTSVIDLYAKSRKYDIHNITAAFFDKMAKDYSRTIQVKRSQEEPFLRLPVEYFMSAWNPLVPVQELCSDTKTNNAVELCQKISESNWDNIPHFRAHGEHLWEYPENWNTPYKGITLDVYRFVKSAKKPTLELQFVQKPTS